MIHLTECPRDAMQGITHFIPTQEKIRYINSLLKVGFNVIDFGSFVSEKVIPQLRDTRQVLEQLELSATRSRLLAIVANVRGAQEACGYDAIQYVGFPFSISETFQLRNTNATMEQSLLRVEEIQQLCVTNKKELVIYISMAMGNPYNDIWHPDIATNWCHRLHTELGVKKIALSDTIGVGQPEIIAQLFTTLIPSLPQVEFGAHLHTTPDTWRKKIESAYSSGCRKFDGALRGYGGCPMAADELTGNMPTENIVAYFSEMNLSRNINQDALNEAMRIAQEVFPVH
ncbi:MAG: hydroxymethylglutaryl-CoA lyase [Flavobacteriales bacterium]|nr:hydroxymethylglutaryl-CoA lyase [Flavobacteriales bacterium]